MQKSTSWQGVDPWCSILCVNYHVGLDSWLNIIFWLCVWRVYLDEITVGILRLRKADHPPQSEWASSNPLKAWRERKRLTFPQRRWNPFCPWPLNWDMGFPTFSLELCYCLSWFSGLSWTQTGITDPSPWVFAFLHSPKVLGASASCNAVSQFLIVIHIFTSYWLCFPGEPWEHTTGSRIISTVIDATRQASLVVQQ